MAEDDTEMLPVTEPRRSRDGDRTGEPEEGESGSVVSGAPFEDGVGSDGDPEDGSENDRDGSEREPTDVSDGEPDAESAEQADREPDGNKDAAGDGNSGDDAGDGPTEGTCDDPTDGTDGDSEAGSGDDAAADLDEDLDGNTTADLDGDSDESGSPGAEDASEGGSGDPSSDEKTTLDRVKAFARTHKRPLIVATALLVSICVTGGGIWYCYDRTETAQAAEARHLVTYGNERDLVNETMAGAKTVLDGDENGEGQITAEQVTDPATLDALRDAYNANKDASAVEPWDSPTGSFESLDSALDYVTFWDVEQSKRDNEAKRSRMEEQRQEVEGAIFDVRTSKREKDVANAQQGLADSIDAASKALETCEGKVSDQGTVDALKEAIASATEVRDADMSGLHYTDEGECQTRIDELNAQSDAVDSAKTAAEDSHADWAAAQRAAAEFASQQAAQRAAHRSGGSARQRSDGTWYVDYTYFYGGNSANSDGTLAEWKDGYYVAHDWSQNGQNIASKPGTVVVDGRTYRYVSSIVVSRDTTWDEVSGFVYANGGIGFQTCDPSGGYLITHYEPM